MENNISMHLSLYRNVELVAVFVVNIMLEICMVYNLDVLDVSLSLLIESKVHHMY